MSLIFFNFSRSVFLNCLFFYNRIVGKIKVVTCVLGDEHTHIERIVETKIKKATREEGGKFDKVFCLLDFER